MPAGPITNPGQGNPSNVYTYTITMSTTSSEPVRVYYRTQDGTATSGNDYTAIPQTFVTIAPNATTATFNVTILGDTPVLPGPKTFKILLVSATTTVTNTPLTISTPTTTVSIVQTTWNSLPTVSPTRPPDRLRSGPRKSIECLHLHNLLCLPPSEPVRVYYRTQDGTATSVTTTRQFLGTFVTMLPGGLTATFNVTIR